MRLVYGWKKANTPTANLSSLKLIFSHSTDSEPKFGILESSSQAAESWILILSKLEKRYSPRQRLAKVSEMPCWQP